MTPSFFFFGFPESRSRNRPLCQMHEARGALNHKTEGDGGVMPFIDCVWGLVWALFGHRILGACYPSLPLIPMLPLVRSFGSEWGDENSVLLYPGGYA